MNFLYKLRNFMVGRHGTDDLSNFLFRIYVLFLLINLFFRNDIIFYIELFILIIILLRYFSKNIYRRGKENKFYLKIKSILLSPFNILIRNIKSQNNVYKRCKKCRTVLKLPLPDNVGFKTVKCPECKHSNKFLILKKQKIDIIRNRKGKR